MDPNRWYFAVTWGLSNALCTTLVRYADQPGTAGTQIVPGTAELPKVSSDGLTYTFTMRPGAKFSNGQPITTKDIKYTFMRLMAPKVNTGTGYYFLNVKGAADYLAGKSTSLPGITTTPTTVTFHLTAADGAFLYKIALPTTCPVPAGTPMKPEETGALETQSASGPFKLQSYQPGRQIVMVFNKNYDQALGARGHVAKIVFNIGVQSTQAVLQIQAGASRMRQKRRREMCSGNPALRQPVQALRGTLARGDDLLRDQGIDFGCAYRLGLRVGQARFVAGGPGRIAASHFFARFRLALLGDGRRGASFQSVARYLLVGHPVSGAVSGAAAARGLGRRPRRRLAGDRLWLARRQVWYEIHLRG
jgi:hypothetical protein